MAPSSARTYQALVGKPSTAVCVSIYGRNITELGRNYDLALSLDPGFIELRLDYLRSVKDVEELKNFLQFPYTIFTFRAPSEGGVSQSTEIDRQLMLSKILSELSPPIVDLEIKTLSNSRNFDLFSKIQRPGTKLIASTHDLLGFEGPRLLENLIVKTAQTYSPDFIKVVRPAKRFADNLKILSMYNLEEKISPTKLIAFCIGELGTFSRIACCGYGSPFTYASLPGRKTAPGQLDIKSMKTLLESWEIR
jgi:3-dehydroquinate dehydratase I